MNITMTPPHLQILESEMQFLGVRLSAGNDMLQGALFTCAQPAIPAMPQPLVPQVEL